MATHLKSPAKDACIAKAEIIENLASVGCTDHEIAIKLGVSEQSLKRHADGPLKKGRADLRISLRRQLVKLAMAGNLGASIWLSKQYLGMREPAKEMIVEDKRVPLFHPKELAQLKDDLRNDTDVTTT